MVEVDQFLSPAERLNENESDCLDRHGTRVMDVAPVGVRPVRIALMVLVVRRLKMPAACHDVGRMWAWKEHVALDTADRGYVPECESIDRAVRSFEQGDRNVLFRYLVAFRVRGHAGAGLPGRHAAPVQLACRIQFSPPFVVLQPTGTSLRRRARHWSDRDRLLGWQHRSGSICASAAITGRSAQSGLGGDLTAQDRY